MRFSMKPDYEESAARYAAFWQREIIDRPPVCFTFRKENMPIRVVKSYPNEKARWFDVDRRVAEMAADMEATEFAYDSLPIAWPNFGPDILASFYGCELSFGPTTSWSTPILTDYGKAPRIDMTSLMFDKLVEFTDKLIEAGKGKFIVGLSDFHPGGDLLAALRGPMDLATDLLEEPEAVLDLSDRLMSEYYAMYGVFYCKLRSAGMPITSWTPLINEGTYYIPSNDFSCMVSEQMYEKFFLPGIARECSFYEKSIYHLDGPGALRHLDAILSIRDLDAVQWVPGFGNEGYDRWVNVYKKIQKAGKGIQMNCSISELDHIFETLRPEGVWFSSIAGITTKEEAEYAVKRITQWK